MLWLRCWLHGGHIWSHQGRGYDGMIVYRCALCGTTSINPSLRSLRKPNGLLLLHHEIAPIIRKIKGET